MASESLTLQVQLHRFQQAWEIAGAIRGRLRLRYAMQQLTCSYLSKFQFSVPEKDDYEIHQKA